MLLKDLFIKSGVYTMEMSSSETFSQKSVINLSDAFVYCIRYFCIFAQINSF
jgi:hypothetical protein